MNLTKTHILCAACVFIDLYNYTSLCGCVCTTAHVFCLCIRTYLNM